MRISGNQGVLSPLVTMRSGSGRTTHPRSNRNAMRMPPASWRLTISIPVGGVIRCLVS